MQRNANGYTLIEIIVSLLLLAVAIVTVFQSTHLSQSSANKNLKTFLLHTETENQAQLNRLRLRFNKIETSIQSQTLDCLIEQRQNCYQHNESARP